jgi:hypothetical protein
MEELKEKGIRAIVDASIKNFVEGFEFRHLSEKENPEGTINMKKNNCFIAELGDEFVFYSAFVRSFDSSFGKVLENIGNQIASFSYKTEKQIVSFITTEQQQHISTLLNTYETDKREPTTDDYIKYLTILPKNIESFRKTHQCDNWFYDEITKTHYLCELKAGGDLDNKKAKSEKLALLTEYFMLKNIMKTGETIKIYFATAYNRFGEGAKWKQPNVQTFFADQELLIGKEYWNFVCNDKKGFDIVFDQYKKSANLIKNALINIRNTYGI